MFSIAREFVVKIEKELVFLVCTEVEIPKIYFIAVNTILSNFCVISKA
jgi:hypothetical protein